MRFLVFWRLVFSVIWSATGSYGMFETTTIVTTAIAQARYNRLPISASKVVFTLPLSPFLFYFVRNRMRILLSWARVPVYTTILFPQWLQRAT